MVAPQMGHGGRSSILGSVIAKAGGMGFHQIRVNETARQ